MIATIVYWNRLNEGRASLKKDVIGTPGKNNNFDFEVEMTTLTVSQFCNSLKLNFGGIRQYSDG